MTEDKNTEISFSELLNSLHDDTIDTSALSHMTMVELISAVNKVLTQDGLNAETADKIRPFLNVLAHRQGLDSGKMLVISVIMNFYVEDGAQTNDIVRLCRCDNMEVLCLFSEISWLVAEGYMLKTNCINGTTYTVDGELFDAYMSNRPFTPKDFACESDLQFLSTYLDIDRKLHREKIDYGVFKHRLERLIEKNEGLPIVKAALAVTDIKMYWAVIFNVCGMAVLKSETSVDIDDYSLLYLAGNSMMGDVLRDELQRGQGVLFEAGLVEHASNDGLRDVSSIQLTRKGHRLLLRNFKLKTAESEQDKTTTILGHRSIAGKKLYFDAGVERQVAQLRDLLSDANFRSIQRRLKAKGMRTGFACIFHGAPGTGKTETALQLARATGRDIMQVNISEMRSMWVGESEKNIQALFDNYRQQVKRRKRCPILLFNEADAIFNQRGRETKRAVDKMENTLQNIILQEMEKLDGILIATTNLRGNMDKAFERRFLYKVEFTRPSLEARTHIWRALMPCLDERTARLLATDFALSGGQIENVARKSIVDEVLYGGPIIPVSRLRQYCREELPDTVRRRSIGFTVAS